MPFTGAAGEQRQEITAQELVAIRSGIDLSEAKRRKLYRRGNVGTAETLTVQRLQPPAQLRQTLAQHQPDRVLSSIL
jgi:hypothetical protein